RSTRRQQQNEPNDVTGARAPSRRLKHVRIRHSCHRSIRAHRPKRILIGFQFVEALRDVLQGIINYSKAQNTNWELQGVDLEVFVHRILEKDIDDAIAHINPEESSKWLNRLVKSKVSIVNTLHDASPRLSSVLSD